MIQLSKTRSLILLTASLFSVSCSIKTQDESSGEASMNEMSVSYSLYGGQVENVYYSTPDSTATHRRYIHTTTMALRDGAGKIEQYQEVSGYPKIRTGNLGFDALFALALEEMRRNSVQQIKDWSYNNAQAIPCDCFQTGEKWHYVWTRDLSYSADLGLAMMDPERVVNSLLFKLSGFRAGVSKPKSVPGSDDGQQVVQDTGSGGSWPISTDRLSWSFAAGSVLPHLSLAQRAEFLKKAYPGLVNTIEIDRIAAFDAEDGLYNGEQSFLDWREQSYALWLAGDLASLATSKSLSTNAGHYNALKLVSKLAQEFGDVLLAKKYSSWAQQLKERVNKRFWLEEQQQYASIIASHFDKAPLKKYDWLGISLAVLSGLIEGERAQKAVANYPHGPMGAPVLFPMQQGVPVYHNRGIWPFVTVYGMNAAKEVNNSRVVDAGYKTLIRSAALNLSNMENYEWLSNKAMFEDPKNSTLNGPVINSKRQLWSVAGYINMVVKMVFGVDVQGEELELSPYVSAGLREREFANQQELTLHDLTLKGKTINITLHLPNATGNQGYYPVKTIKLNGENIGASIPLSALAEDNQIHIYLGELVDDAQTITQVSGDPASTNDPALYGPYEAEVENVRIDGSKARLTIRDNPNSGKLVYNIFKDGQMIGSTDKKSFSFKADEQTVTACFSVEALYPESGNHSHHSKPYCLGQSKAVYLKAEETEFEIKTKGRYALQFDYKNLHHQTNLGVTNGVKMVSVLNSAGAVVAQGIVQAPHTPKVDAHVGAEIIIYRGKDNPYRLSTPLLADLKPGLYQIKVEEFFNMSYLKSNETFNGSGGLKGPVNSIELNGIRIMPINKF